MSKERSTGGSRGRGRGRGRHGGGRASSAAAATSQQQHEGDGRQARGGRPLSSDAPLDPPHVAALRRRAEGEAARRERCRRETLAWLRGSAGDEKEQEVVRGWGDLLKTMHDDAIKVCFRML